VSTAGADPCSGNQPQLETRPNITVASDPRECHCRPTLFADRVKEIRSLDKVKVLTRAGSRLRRTCRVTCRRSRDHFAIQGRRRRRTNKEHTGQAVGTATMRCHITAVAVKHRLSSATGALKGAAALHSAPHVTPAQRQAATAPASATEQPGPPPQPT
jgi:hypothetical protein